MSGPELKNGLRGSARVVIEAGNMLHTTQIHHNVSALGEGEEREIGSGHLVSGPHA